VTAEKLIEVEPPPEDRDGLAPRALVGQARALKTGISAAVAAGSLTVCRPHTNIEIEDTYL
jgi:hypothetical protein